MASASPTQTKATTTEIMCSAAADEPFHEVKDDVVPGRGGGVLPSGGSESGKPRASLATNCCLLLVGVGGGALLAWWALSFHQSNEQLWMVPVGLVLLGTPIFAWLSLFASGVCTNLQLPWAKPAPSAPAAAPDLDQER